MTFEPKYIEFHQRIRMNLLKVLFLVIVYGTIFFFLSSQLNIEILFILLVSFLITLLLNFKTDRIYLKSVLIENEIVKVIMVDRDKEIESLNSPINHVKIIINEKPLLLFNSLFGKNFKLTFQEKINGQYRIAIEQPECHEWTHAKFKEVFREYCKQKST